MNTPVKEKLLELLDYLNHGLVERDSTLKAALLTMLAGENLLLVGPPGTAKSLIARKVAECLAHDGDAEHAGGYFEYLLTKFSTPEEIFGPLSISELKADRFKRNTAGYLPSVRMAFLDEIFKASSSILNALLTILNERLYHNGAEAQKVPLQALIAASNELPTGQEELDALYDRFLVRSFVDYVSEENLPRLLDKPGPAPTITPLSTADLTAIRQAAEAVTLQADNLSAIQKIWAGHKQLFKEDRRENLSDRRLRKVVGLLCISAATNGRKEVDLSDLLLLKDCLWNHPDNVLKVRELVMNILRAFSCPVPFSDMEDKTAKKTTAHMPIAKIGAVLKGYKGCGTEYDPILIETQHDLAGLERPEVGQQGYWFRQTADIDCCELSTWLKISFRGHFDGGGHSVTYKDGSKPLFHNVQASTLAKLRLVNLSLAKDATDCDISACNASHHLVLGYASDSRIVGCQTDGTNFIRRAGNCNISHCQAMGVLVQESASKCNISQCRTGHVLIDGEAITCTIQDCQVQVNGVWSTNLSSSTTHVGGIARKLSEGSLVERCFVAGNSPRGDRVIHFSGIASCLDKNSTIRQCAFGAFTRGNDVYQHESCRIVTYGEGIFHSNFKLENNVALDCHRGESDPNGTDGKSLSAALFTQHYFEHTLDWNFTTVWRWNDQLKQPELRSVGVEVVQAEPEDDDMGDLLTQQLTANLWL